MSSRRDKTYTNQELIKNHLAEFSQKDRLIELNHEQLELFKLSDRNKLVIRLPAMLPGMLFSSETVTYSKKTIKVGQGEVQVIYRNGEPESFLWKTTQENIKKALCVGIFPTQALTSKVISALGSYLSQVSLHRAHVDGMVSNKYLEKMALIRVAQERIGLLQPLERLVNGYNDSCSPEENRSRIVSVLKDCVKYLEGNVKFTDQENKNSIESSIDSYDVRAQEKINEYMKVDAGFIQNEFITKLERQDGSFTPEFLKDILSSTGPNSLMTAIKLLMQAIIKQTQEINQNLTFARTVENWIPHSLFRGDLNSYCEDALREIDNHEADYHNPILPEHQGIFYAEAEKAEDKKVEGNKATQCSIVDFEYLKKNKQAIDTALMAICEIEDVDKIDWDDRAYNHKLVSSNGVTNSYKLEQTRRTKWWFGSVPVDRIEDEKTADTGTFGIVEIVNLIADFLYRQVLKICNFLLRISIAVVNFASGILLTSFDLVWGMLGGILNIPAKSIVNRFKIKVAKQKPKTKFTELSNAMSTNEAKEIISIRDPIVFQFGQWLGKVVRGVTWELISGIVVFAKQLTIDLPAVLKDDYYVNGRGGLRNEKAIMADFDFEIKGIEKKFQEINDQLNSQHQQIDAKKSGLFNDNPIATQEIKNSHFARIPYSLSPGEWDDISNASLRGLKAFVETISHPVHAKHPLLGLIFNTVYMLGGFSVLIPGNIPAPAWYTKFSMTLAKKLAHGELGRAIGSGVTQAQVTMAIVEALYHGRKSWIAEGISLIEKNAVEILIVISLAVLWGELLRECVPGLGPYIDEEMGDIGFITLGSAGAKIGIILVELLEVREQEKRDLVAESKLLQDLKRELTQASAKKTSVAASEAEIDSIIKNLTSEESIQELKPAIELQKQANRDLPSIVNEDPHLDRLQFIYKLQSAEHLLPHLCSRTKRELLEVAKNKFSDQPEMVAALQSKMNPAVPESIAMKTMVVLLSHITAIARDLAAIVTLNLQPLKDHAEKIAKDLARVVRAVSKLVQFTVLVLHTVLYTPFRAIFDSVLNGIVARAEGWLRGNRHYVSTKTYAASTSLRQFYEKTRQEVSRPTDFVCKAVTTPAAEVAFQNAMKINASRFFSKKQGKSAHSSSSNLLVNNANKA